MTATARRGDVDRERFPYRMKDLCERTGLPSELRVEQLMPRYPPAAPPTPPRARPPNALPSVADARRARGAAQVPRRTSRLAPSCFASCV